MKFKNLSYDEKRRFFMKILPLLLVASILQMVAVSRGYNTLAEILKLIVGIFGIFFLYVIFSKTKVAPETPSPETPKPTLDQDKK